MNGGRKVALTTQTRGVKILGRHSNTAKNEVLSAYRARISAEVENQSASAISAEPLAH